MPPVLRLLAPLHIFRYVSPARRSRQHIEGTIASNFAVVVQFSFFGGGLAVLKV